MKRTIVLALLVLCSLPVLAIDAAPLLDDPEKQARYTELIQQLRCLQCQGETVADTQAMFAKDIRRQVREMVQAGSSDDEVRQYMVDRYGKIILLRPQSTWLWLLPGLFLLGGVAIAWRVLQQRRSLLAEDTSEPGDELEDRS